MPTICGRDGSAVRVWIGIASALALVLTLMLAGTAHGAIVVNELRASTTTHGVGDEFVELANSGPTGVNLQGWDVTATSAACDAPVGLRPASAASSFPAPFFLGPGQKALLAPAG
jgi:hypothetical protein